MDLTEQRVITAIRQQRRNSNRVNVHLDGQYAFSLATIVAAGLELGQRLGQAEIEVLEQQDSFEKAKQSAYRYLSYRPRSTAEIARNLARKGFDQVIIDKVIVRLSEIDLLDDWAFAQYWIEQRNTFRPRSRLALRQELYEKGLDRELIERSVSEVDELEAARRAARKNAYRWERLPTEEFQAKAVQFLRRRGFDYGTARAVAIELLQSDEATET